MAEVIIKSPTLSQAKRVIIIINHKVRPYHAKKIMDMVLEGLINNAWMQDFNQSTVM